jgi:hypothetical protein
VSIHDLSGFGQSLLAITADPAGVALTPHSAHPPRPAPPHGSAPTALVALVPLQVLGMGTALKLSLQPDLLLLVRSKCLGQGFCRLTPQLLPVDKIYHPQLFKPYCLHCRHHTLKVVGALNPRSTNMHR